LPLCGFGIRLSAGESLLLRSACALCESVPALIEDEGASSRLELVLMGARKKLPNRRQRIMCVDKTAPGLEFPVLTANLFM
jgi:hypothetical protein